MVKRHENEVARLTFITTKLKEALKKADQQLYEARCIAAGVCVGDVVEGKLKSYA